MKVKNLLLSAALLSLLGSQAQASIVQGFEGGTIAPGTAGPGYSNLAPCVAGGANELQAESSYAVTPNAGDCHGSWFSVLPHDGAALLAVNGNTAVGVVYEQTVGGLNIGSTYDLTGWFAGLYTVNPAEIAWNITAGGTAPVNSFLTNTTGIWQQNGIRFVATGTSLTFNIAISTTQASGNDFALDTIELDEVPEPASVLLVGLGLAGLGIVRRRKA